MRPMSLARVAPARGLATRPGRTGKAALYHDLGDLGELFEKTLACLGCPHNRISMSKIHKSQVQNLKIEGSNARLSEIYG